MSVTVKYKEFESIEELKKYYEDVYNSFLGDYRINKDYFWKRIKSKDSIQYIIYFSNSKNITNVVSESKIGSFVIIGYMGYFYLEDNKIYTVTVHENRDDIIFENKLYHLIHGPKAISIPEAFKVLAL